MTEEENRFDFETALKKINELKKQLLVKDGFLYWQQQIRNWKTSGLSQKQFCRQQSLAISTFSYWKRRIGIAETETIKFYPVINPCANAKTG